MNTLTLAELCELLGVDAKRVRAWRKEGMPAEKQGRTLAFDPSAVEKWLLDNGKATREAEEEPEAIATTAAEAARMLGISYDRFNKWITEPGFPGKPGKPGCREAWFPIRQIQEWRLARFGSGDGSPAAATSRMNELREKKLEVDTERSRLELERELGQILDLGDVTRFSEFTVATAKAILEEIPDRVDSRLPGKLTAKVRSRIRKTIERSLRDAFAAIESLLGGDKDPTEEEEEPPESSE